MATGDTNLTNLILSGTLAATGLITATGGVSGAVTGGVTGNVTGNVTGQVTGGINFPIQELTASGAFTNISQVMQLNHATVIIAATLADPVAGQFIIIWDDSASGTAAHTVTLNNATWDGTHKIATFAAPGKALVCYAASTTRYNILVNLGTVAFS